MAGKIVTRSASLVDPTKVSGGSGTLQPLNRGSAPGLYPLGGLPAVSGFQQTRTSGLNISADATPAPMSEADRIAQLESQLDALYQNGQNLVANAPAQFRSRLLGQ